MRSRLKAAAAVLGADYEEVRWHELTAERVDRIREALLASGTTAGTVNVGPAAIRGLARTAYDLRMMEYPQWHAIRELRNGPREPAPTGRVAKGREFAALLAACGSDRGAAGVRDTALLAAMYAGVRCPG